MAGRDDSRRIVDVLQPDRDTVQRATVSAGGDLVGGPSRIGPRPLGRAADIGVELRIYNLDPLEARLRQFDRRQFLALDPRRRLGAGQIVPRAGYRRPPSGPHTAAGRTTRPRP